MSSYRRTGAQGFQLERRGWTKNNIQESKNATYSPPQSGNFRRRVMLAAIEEEEEKKGPHTRDRQLLVTPKLIYILNSQHWRYKKGGTRITLLLEETGASGFKRTIRINKNDFAHKSNMQLK